jgi:hypothetical protein
MVHKHAIIFNQVRLLRTVDRTLRPILPILPEEVPPQGTRYLGRVTLTVPFVFSPDASLDQDPA